MVSSKPFYRVRLLSIPALAFALIAGASGADVDASTTGSSQHYRPETCHVALLHNGFTIPYVRQEAIGPDTRLSLCPDSGDGYMEVSTNDIDDLDQGQSTVSIMIEEPAAAPEIVVNRTPSTTDVKGLIVNAASRYRIDPDFIVSVIAAESGFNPKAMSPKGARGLMQLMPETAAILGVENIFDPAANVEGGTKYLRQLLDQYHGDAVKTLAAYNAGPDRVEQYGGVPPYKETHAYVTRIIDDYNRKKRKQQQSSSSSTR